MKIYWVFGAALTFGGILALGACSGSSDNGTGGAAGTCTQDSDCSTGEFCDPDTATCTAADTTGACPGTPCAPDEMCDTASGFCLFVGCTMDSECATGETCNAGKCEVAPGMTGPTCKTCACTDLLSAGGCANLCDSMQNGNPNTPNFCNDHAALPQCAKCLEDNCGVTDTTDPTTCN
jgi:Cys-rich repeat protein